MTPAERTLSLRPVGDGDEEFLCELYATTRVDELAPLGWDETQRAAFLKMQFAAQTLAYHQQSRDASFDMILVDAQPAGRLTVDRRPERMRIIDIALLPGFRNAGIGTVLLRRLQTDVAARGGVIELHVERFNRAFGLYTRLGFRVVADAGVYVRMEWQP